MASLPNVLAVERAKSSDLCSSGPVRHYSVRPAAHPIFQHLAPCPLTCGPCGVGGAWLLRRVPFVSSDGWWQLPRRDAFSCWGSQLWLTHRVRRMRTEPASLVGRGHPPRGCDGYMVRPKKVEEGEGTAVKKRSRIVEGVGKKIHREKRCKKVEAEWGRSWGTSIVIHPRHHHRHHQITLGKRWAFRA